LIFVVDDSATALRSAEMILLDAGYSVSIFDSPLGITREVKRQNPDLCLVDVSMPALNGDKLVRLIRGIRDAPATLVLLYSARSEAELEQLAADCGADGYTRKSDNPDDLVNAVRKQLAQRQKPSGNAP
jgi:DNA-binding response OmpR family regulator